MEDFIKRINKDTRAGFLYTIDNLFVDINELYDRLEDGESFNEITNALRYCCQTYLKDNEEKNL